MAIAHFPIVYSSVVWLCSILNEFVVNLEVHIGIWNRHCIRCDWAIVWKFPLHMNGVQELLREREREVVLGFTMFNKLSPATETWWCYWSGKKNPMPRCAHIKPSSKQWVSAFQLYTVFTPISIIIWQFYWRGARRPSFYYSLQICTTTSRLK